MLRFDTILYLIKVILCFGIFYDQVSLLSISWGLYNLTASSSHIFDKLNDKYSFEIDAILVPFLSRILRVIIVIIAISVVAQEFGFNVSGFVAGLGIGGLAISLAAKDAISEFIWRICHYHRKTIYNRRLDYDIYSRRNG